MRINVISNAIYAKQNNLQKNNKKPVFKASDNFLPIKQIPDMVCACCGKKVLSAEKFAKICARITKDLKYNLDKGGLNFTKRLMPDVWDYLCMLSEQYPKKSLEQILEKDNGTYIALKQKVSSYYQPQEAEQGGNKKIFNDRKINAAFFDIVAHSRGYMKNSEEVIKKLQPLKQYLFGLKKEAFEQLEIYSRKYPDKTLSEIVNLPEIYTFHELKNIMQRTEMREKSDYHFENILKMVQKKNPSAVEEFVELKEKALELLETERDPMAREYYMKELYLQALEKNNCESLKKGVLKELKEIPLSYLTVDSFFAHAKNEKFNDGMIIASIFQAVLTSEEHLFAISDGGSDKTSNKIIMHRSCNMMRASRPYSEVLKYRPDMIKHATKQVKIVIDNLLKGKLTHVLDFYPINIAQNLKKVSNGLIDVDLTKYCVANIKKFEQERDLFEKKLNEQIELRNSVLSKHSKINADFYGMKDHLAEINANIKEYKNSYEVKKALVEKMQDYLEKSRF